MTGLKIANFEKPDETLDMGGRARADLVSLDGLQVYRITCEPGWQFTVHTDPNPCRTPHAAFVHSGRLGIRMEDGSEAEASAGEIAVIEPGHDAWTVGNDPCILIDFGANFVRATDVP